MRVPMQRGTRPQMPHPMRLMIPWVIWGSFLITLAMIYYVGWIMPHEPRSESVSAPVNAMTIGAGITGTLSLVLNALRRILIRNFGIKLVVMIIGAALAETLALYGFTIKFIFNTALDRALFLLIACIVLHLLNMPTDFKMESPPPLPGEPYIPPPIG